MHVPLVAEKYSCGGEVQLPRRSAAAAEKCGGLGRRRHGALTVSSCAQRKEPGGMISELSSRVLFEYKVRKTQNQKTRFIELVVQDLVEDGHKVLVEESKGLIRNRNIVVGDLSSARIICGAHYDTPARFILPNLVTPRNIPLLIFYQLFLALVLVMPCLVAALLIGAVTTSELMGLLVFELLLVLMIFLLLAGPANPNNFNDNTSGTVTLIEILKKLSAEERAGVAVVFFDNEEKGLVGSHRFAKLHQRELAGKLVVNFDCVSDGDILLLVRNRRMRKDAEASDVFVPSFENSFAKEILCASCFNPSDQMSFGNNRTVTFAAMRKARLVGLYVGRIHTSRDVIFDVRNIKVLSDGLCSYLRRSKT